MVKTIKLVIIIALILVFPMVKAFSAETKTYGELLHNFEIVYGLDEGLEEAKEITRGEMIVLLVRMLVGESRFWLITKKKLFQMLSEKLCPRH